MIKEECKYWSDDLGLSTITGDDHCKEKCEDYE